MTRLIDAELLTSKISFTGFPHIDRNGRIDKSWVYELINSCPTVEERPQGEWGLINVVTMPYLVAYSCPFCKEWGNIQTFKPNFCPNCGADMREADNGS